LYQSRQPTISMHELWTPARPEGSKTIHRRLEEMNMSFLLPCPNCGRRSVYEFDFGGEYHTRPSHDAPLEDWTKYLYFRANTNDVQTEWWYHWQGCQSWFLANRC